MLYILNTAFFDDYLPTLFLVKEKWPPFLTTTNVWRRFSTTNALAGGKQDLAQY